MSHINNSIANLISKGLQLWPESIDISDGELRSGGGFFSHNLSAAWSTTEDNVCGDNDLNFMVWAIFRVLHEAARKKFKKKEYTIFLHEISAKIIEQQYHIEIKKTEELS